MTGLTLSRQRHQELVDCLSRRFEPVARSRHFTVYTVGGNGGSETAGDVALDPGDVIVVHDFATSQIDNNIGCYVANELLPLLTPPSGTDDPCDRGGDGYGYSEQEVFERYVGAIVRSMDGNERRAWHLFYDNTLAGLRGRGADPGESANVGEVADLGESAEASPGAEPGLPGQDFIADFGAIYRQTVDLVAEIPDATVLDAATCFGFLPLVLATRLEAAGHAPRLIAGIDLNPALVALADDYARRRGYGDVRYIHGDILAPAIAWQFAGLPARFDVVTAIHVLEHLEPGQTGQALDNLWALARRRLVIAVPLEAAPDPRFGHLQVFDRETLLALGRRWGRRCRYFEHHGGWVVIDRPPAGEDRAHAPGRANGGHERGRHAERESCP